MESKNMIESSIVILAWYHKNQHSRAMKNECLWWADKCLKRMFEVTPRDKYELIMVDNGSEKFSIPETSVDEYFSNADTLVSLDKNYGYPKGFNEGIKKAKGKYVFCLSNDVLPFPGWYEPLIETFSLKLDKPVGCVHPWSVGCRGLQRALDIKYDDPNLIYKKKPVHQLGKVWGGVHVTPRHIFETLKKNDGHYFDESFGLGYSEDKDLYHRIRLLGYETCRCHKSAVYHQTGTTHGKIDDHKERYKKNREKLHKKWNDNTIHKAK